MDFGVRKVCPSLRVSDYYTAAAAAKSLQSCPILCNPMNCSMPGFPVFHYLPELVQTQVH